MRIVFIRHGDPDYEKDNLTAKGKREAELLSQRVKKWNVKDFYCSPLGRARATAEPSMQKIGRDYTILPWAEEFIHLVDVNSTTPMWTENGKRIPWDYLPEEWTIFPENFANQEWTQSALTSGGNLEKYYKEVCDGLDELLLKYGLRRKGRMYDVIEHSDDTIVIFCHYGLTMIALSHLLNIPALTLLHGLFTAPTSVTILNSEERSEKHTAYFRSQVIGDTTHLHDGNEEISSSGYFAPVMQEKVIK